MPLYTYECEDCGAETDFHAPLHAIPTSIQCPCGGKANRIIAQGHGGFQSDQPTWLDDAHKGLKDSGESPFESRSEWKKHLKTKGIVERG